MKLQSVMSGCIYYVFSFLNAKFLLQLEHFLYISRLVKYSQLVWPVLIQKDLYSSRMQGPAWNRSVYDSWMNWPPWIQNALTYVHPEWSPVWTQDTLTCIYPECILTYMNPECTDLYGSVYVSPVDSVSGRTWCSDRICAGSPICQYFVYTSCVTENSYRTERSSSAEDIVNFFFKETDLRILTFSSRSIQNWYSETSLWSPQN